MNEEAISWLLNRKRPFTIKQVKNISSFMKGCLLSLPQPNVLIVWSSKQAQDYLLQNVNKLSTKLDNDPLTLSFHCLQCEENNPPEKCPHVTYKIENGKSGTV